MTKDINDYLLIFFLINNYHVSKKKIPKKSSFIKNYKI